MAEFSHLDEKGKAKMVDVTAKDPSAREAIACGKVLMHKNTISLIERGNIPKGDVYAVAKIAGIMAAKKTSDMIPMCHPLELTGVDIEFTANEALGEITIHATVKNVGRTGVEMEAMTAAAVAALTLYDMVKAVEKAASIERIILLEKSGGKSGVFKRPPFGKQP